ncbi:MAG: ATP phosphoribosyltransferase regulatory subunit [Patescibacteria group bacterium]
MKTRKPQCKKQISIKRDNLRVHGTRGIFPTEETAWKFLATSQEATADLHDFHFIEIPYIETAQTVLTSMRGGAQGIICIMKPSSGGADIALRQGTELGIIRSYIEEKLGRFAQPLRVYHHGPVFLCDADGKKTTIKESYRQGFDIIGDNDPIYDGQIITAALSFLDALHIKNAIFRINALGCKTCRTTYREKLRTYYGSNKSKLCDLCLKTLELGIIEEFECASSKCKSIHDEIPSILDYLCYNCNNHFKTVLELLEDNGIAYEPCPRLSRVFPYYSKTVFEFRAPSGQLLAEGGRYDYLADMLWGRNIPGVGVSFHASNILKVLALEKMVFKPKIKTPVFFVAVGEQAKKASLRYISEIRSHNIPVVESIGKKSLQVQLKIARKHNSVLALIFGQREVYEDTIIIRDLSSGAQETILLSNLMAEVKKRLK